MAILRFQDWPLAWKMIALLLAASSLPLAVAGLAEFWQARRIVDAQAGDLLAARTEQVADQIDAFHLSYQRPVRVIAQYEPIVRFCAAPSDARTAEQPQIQALLDLYARKDSSFRGLAILDRRGVVSIATEAALVGRDDSSRTYFVNAMRGQSVISEIYVARPEAGSAPSIAYAEPVQDATGQVTGVAVLFVRAAAFWDLVSAQNGKAGDGSFSVLYDQFGIRIAHSYNPDEIFHPGGALDPATIEALVAERRFGEKTREYLESPSVVDAEFARARSAAPDPNTTFLTFSQANQQDNMTVARRLKTVPWTLFSLVPKQSVQAPAQALVGTTIIACGIIIVLALASGALFSRRILLPIAGLSKAATAIAAGHLDIRVPPDGNDEIGQLGKAFNDMAAALQQSREELDDIVRVRTEALAQANASLEEQNVTLSLQTSQLERRQRLTASYGHTLVALAGEGSLDEVLRNGVLEAAPTANAVVMVCYHLDANGVLRPRAGYGVGHVQTPSPGPLGGLAWEALHTKTAVVIDPVPPDCTLRFDAVIAAGPPRAIVLVPLVLGDRNVGVLVCGCLEPVPADILAFLSDLAIPFALTIVRATLFEQTGRFADELSQTNEELRRQAEELLVQREELQVQQRELEVKNREVERATQLKTEFLANMSHELRTPLNAVIGFSELLVDDAATTLEQRHARYLHEILGSGRHLLGLINDILDLAKIEAGRVSLDREPLTPSAIIDEARTLLDPVARKRKIVIEPSGDLSARAVLADRGKLLQILLNLLSNAVKFSSDGSKVSVGTDDINGFVRFWVRDQGPGIDQSLIPHLFTPFVQGENALIKKHQGTGLGLAISKRLVEQHGGTIDVQTGKGVGTTFRFTIPAVSPSTRDPVSPYPTSTPPQPHPTTAPDASSRPLVLIVEDNPASAHLLRAYMSSADYDVVEARDVDTAIDMAENLHPRAVLLDLVLNNGDDGFTVLDELKRRDSTRDIPILIESVLTDAARGLAKGAAEYLTKPISRDLLLDRLKELIRHPTPDRAPTVLAIDDDPRVLDVLRPILEPAGYRFMTAMRGREGIELAADERPDLIMVDILLPDITGFEVIDALMADERTRDVPLIVLTAADLTDAERHQLKERVSALAEKGDFTRDAVLAAVNRATGRGAQPNSGCVSRPVVVIDDHDMNRELIRALLERAGYSVVEAEDGESGIETVRRIRPALVFLDLAMPVMDGFETVRRLKADPDTADIPVVALTALAMRDDERRALDAGCDAYLTKPIDRKSLDAVLDAFLKDGAA